MATLITIFALALKTIGYRPWRGQELLYLHSERSMKKFQSAVTKLLLNWATPCYKVISAVRRKSTYLGS